MWLINLKECIFFVKVWQDSNLSINYGSKLILIFLSICWSYVFDFAFISGLIFGFILAFVILLLLIQYHTLDTSLAHFNPTTFSSHKSHASNHVKNLWSSVKQRMNQTLNQILIEKPLYLKREAGEKSQKLETRDAWANNLSIHEVTWKKNSRHWVKDLGLFPMRIKREWFMYDRGKEGKPMGVCQLKVRKTCRRCRFLW